MLRTALLILAVILMTSARSAYARQTGAPELEGTPTEIWVWNKIRNGHIADLDEHCGLQPKPQSNDRDWDAPCRTIRAAFIVRVLTQEPWRIILPFRGLRIHWAQITEPLDLTAARVQAEVQLKNSLFKEKVELRRAHFDGLLEFSGSTFESEVDADSLRVGGHLLVSGGVTVRGQLLLRGTKVDGDLDMVDSIFKGPVDANSVRVGGHLLLGSVFETNTVPLVTFGHIKGNFLLSSAKLPGLDLSNTTIDGGLRFGAAEGSTCTHWPQWFGDAKLILYGVRTKVLDNACPDLKPALPMKFDLRGLVYDQLASSTSDRRPREVWYQKWLERDKDFARQPYQHFASLLRSSGHSDVAEDVLFEARDRELTDAWSKGQYWRAVTLALLRITIGYGIGSGLLLIFVYIALVTAIGVWVLWYSEDARSRGLLWRCGASFDHLLPIVELNKEFGQFFSDEERKKLSGLQHTYFAFHTLTGYVFGLIVAAALAGLTQAG